MQEKYSEFFRVYVKEDHDDPHTEFAKAIGTPRSEAKRIAYKIAYKTFNSQIMKGYRDEPL